MLLSRITAASIAERNEVVSLLLRDRRMRPTGCGRSMRSTAFAVPDGVSPMRWAFHPRRSRAGRCFS
jgi:hypothetical protein